MTDHSKAFWSRVAAVLSAALAAWLLIGALEWSRLDQAQTAHSYIVVLGLIGPWVFGAALAGGGVSWWFEREAPRGVQQFFIAAGSKRDAFLASWSRVVALVGAAFVWVLALGSFGLERLAEDEPITQGAGGYALFALVSGVMLLGAGLRVSGALQVLFLRMPTIGAVLAPSLILGLLLFVLIQTGETSGTGGVWKMWGVFRRDELDLALPMYGLVALAFGYQLPTWLPRLSPLISVMALSVVTVTVWIGSRGDVMTLFEVERSTALAGRVLPHYQTWADADGDGFSRHFGGGDCDDSNPAVNPEAVDVPANGIDEDCSGSDAIPPPPRQEAPPNVVASRDQEIAVARDLPKQPNVLLLTIDTLRYDLGYTGYPRPISPNIDALAARSTVYNHAYALASYTSKSLGPALIGRYGSETNRGWRHFNLYPPRDRMLQERLSAAGVFTISVQAHWYFDTNTGLGRGFDVLDMSAAPEDRQGEGDKSVNSPALSDAAIRQLKEPKLAQKPFFMWVHYLDPHAEYVPHQEFSFGSEPRDLYDGEIAFTDHHVGRVLNALKESPYADNTVVILASDHGEAFGEHGMMRHGFELWEAIVRVPLVVYVPGQPPRRIDQRRSLIDLVPSVLDVFDVPLPDGTKDFISGQSLLDEWLGAPPQERPVFLDMPAGPYNGDRQAFIERDLKLITSSSRPMGLYDLAKDPGETNNLMKDTKLTMEALDRMKEFRSKLRVIRVNPQ